MHFDDPKEVCTESVHGALSKERGARSRMH